MFDKKLEERLSLWRSFRDSVENSENPLQEVIDFYKDAPSVSLNTDPWDNSIWPTPWELLEENLYCDFIKILAICYTLQLTERFNSSSFEIHIGIDYENTETHYLLFVDKWIIGFDHGIIFKDQLPDSIISQKVYVMPELH